jgi:cytochrome d ubiquinol oxidase subunit I
MVAMTFSGWVATLAGWYVTEIGRQPWLVHGVLRTADAATQRPIPIGTSLTLYLLLYMALIAAYVSVLFYLAGKGGDQPPDERARQAQTAGGPHGT